MSDPTSAATPRPPQAQYTCPHCGGALDLGAMSPTPIADSLSIPPTATPDPAPAARLLGAWLDRVFPITSALGGSHLPTSILTRARRVQPRWVRWVLLLLPFMLIVLWFLGRTGFGASPPASAAMPPTPTPVAVGTVPTREQAALLSVVAHYNAADQQVAATLALDPIRPFLDDSGPLLRRRSQALARRKQAGATHVTRLLRWAVGAITVDAPGTTATIVTQETWENQESGVIAPQIATARVTYILRRANPQAPWRIYDATSTIV